MSEDETLGFYKEYHEWITEQRNKPLIGGTLEENTRLINLIIGRLVRLEWRVNAIADCIEDIEKTAKKLEEIFAILADDLRDDS